MKLLNFKLKSLSLNSACITGVVIWHFSGMRIKARTKRARNARHVQQEKVWKMFFLCLFSLFSLSGAPSLLFAYLHLPEKHEKVTPVMQANLFIKTYHFIFPGSL